MVSLDDPDRNREFAEALEARHVLLSDPGGAVARAYGVVSPGGAHARRWTFYVDPQGVIREIDKAVDVRTAGQDIARNLERLRFPVREPGDGGGP